MTVLVGKGLLGTCSPGGALVPPPGKEDEIREDQAASGFIQSHPQVLATADISPWQMAGSSPGPLEYLRG